MKMPLKHSGTIEQSKRYAAAWCEVTGYLYPREYSRKQRCFKHSHEPHSYAQALQMFDIARRRTWHVRAHIWALERMPQTWVWDIAMKAVLRWWTQYIELQHVCLRRAEYFYGKDYAQNQRIRDRRHRLEADEVYIGILEGITDRECD